MNTLTDVMNYFHFVMIAVYVLGGITVITTSGKYKKEKLQNSFSRNFHNGSVCIDINLFLFWCIGG